MARLCSYRLTFPTERRPDILYTSIEDACAGTNWVADPKNINSKTAVIAANCDAPGGGSSAGSLLGIILPAALIIGGIMWWLNHDGKTYIQDSSRVN